ncbi:putative FAD dependent oxidoreductase [Seiridium cardinale]
MATPSSFTPPSSVLIIGSGVFGLSTAYALTKRPAWSKTRITVLDRSSSPNSSKGKPQFPSEDSSSIDSSRIVRSDYADPAYARLAAVAQAEWRKPGPQSWGGDGRYAETGFVICADNGPETLADGITKTGMGYAKGSYVNALDLVKLAGLPGSSVVELNGREKIAMASGTGAPFGDWGYLNKRSGWANAEKSMAWLYERVVETGRVEFVAETVEKLELDGKRVTGAKLQDGTTLKADLVVVAAGAWTPSLVDLRGQAVATGQVIAYTDISDQEQARLAKVPVLMNMSQSTFMITPSNNVLKIGRHSYGYQNPRKVSSALVVPKKDGESAFPKITVSQPYTHLDDSKLWIPAEGERDLREGLRKMVPWPELQDRPWTHSRICWYTDTATGDFLITYHPHWDGLFLATGGSGHGFKFLPVLGENIADTIEKNYPAEFRDKWSWKEPKDIEKQIITEDGSRGGKVGLLLMNELQKNGSRL